ncbi:MAG: 3-dehydroquinate synthase [Bacteroidales bacterium]|jgi:3-dehydroquinate synthase|nr:3-dehydroquinate synthase [Bacteroidales bacterium]MCI2121697.1 3-dehydroquinate synthase [Bacteroidales bacterium]MCI2144878.1 3-dehydroquinate synthase [Bacteroidales bacterium]
MTGGIKFEICENHMESGRIIKAQTIRELEGLLGKTAERHRELFVITDDTVRGLYGENLLKDTVPPGHVISVPAGENSKSMQTAADILSSLLKAGASRDCFLTGFGGGVVSDLTGFVASIYKRGVKFGLVPTTLLGMVDASIGGKNGVDITASTGRCKENDARNDADSNAENNKATDGSDITGNNESKTAAAGGTVRYKNMAGTFNRPEFIIQCYPLLNTLPEAEMKSGETEMLKTFIIGDAAAYEETVSLLKAKKANKEQPSDFDSEFAGLINRATEIKVKITDEDPFDENKRHVLNLGHTFGHAIEELFPGRCTHGAAVARGIIMAAALGARMNITPKELATGIELDFEDLGLPPAFDIEEEKLTSVLRNDKKYSDGHLDFAFIRALGDVFVKSLVLE